MRLMRSQARFAFCLALAVDQAAQAQEPPSPAAVEALIEQERFPEAERMLEEILHKRAGGTEVEFRLGYVQFRQRKLPAARQRFLSIVKTAPPAYNSRYFLGRIALMENRPVEAITWLEPVVASRETIYDAAAQLAAAYQSAGQPRKAIEPLRLAIQQSPWEGGPYYRLGRLYQQLGQAQLANEALGTAARLKSANATDIQTLMEASRAAQEGRTVEAVRLGRLIAERPGADPSTLVALGLLWVKSGLQAEALEAFEAASHRNEKHFASQFNLGLALLQMGRSADSLGPLARAAALLPQSLDANLTLGLAAVMSQRYVEARTALEAARRLEPSNKKVAALLATACLRLGAASEAVGILRSSGAATAGPPEGLLILVEALNATGETEAALEAAQRAGRSFLQSSPAQMALAQQLARAGRYQEAQPVFERVLQLEPGQPEASLGLADALQKAGNHEAAIQAYRTALDYRSTTLAARLGSARSLVSLKRLEQARQMLEDGLGSHASEPSLRLELSRVYARLGLADLAAREAQFMNNLKALESKP
jgi:tetratricopeptide (TPR) repeat protein